MGTGYHFGLVGHQYIVCDQAIASMGPVHERRAGFQGVIGIVDIGGKICRINLRIPPLPAEELANLLPCRKLRITLTHRIFLGG
jgi:hypothetical protein